MGIRPAAKLLSVLLYRYSVRKEHQQDAENMNEIRQAQGKKADQDTTFRIFRTQAQLIEDMCGELTAKTLHDVAIPALQLLGYLDIDESWAIHCYDVHLDIVREAIETLKLDRKEGTRKLEDFIRVHLQLEKFLIDPQLEKVLIDKKKFLLELEKVLIANRKSSYCRRGRKPKSEDAREGDSENTQIPKIGEISNKTLSLGKRENVDLSSLDDEVDDEDNTPTEPDMPAVSGASPHTNGNTALALQNGRTHLVEVHTEPELPEFKCDPQEVRLQFNYWRINPDAPMGTYFTDPNRGRPTKRKELDDQEEVCRGLARLWTLRQLYLLRDEMRNHDKFWKEPRNRVRVNEFTILDKCYEMAQQYRERKAEEKKSSHNGNGSVSGAVLLNGNRGAKHG